MKQAFEKGGVASSTPSSKNKAGTANSTSTSLVADPAATSTPKRKRTSATRTPKNRIFKEEKKYKPSLEEEDDDDEFLVDIKTKRAKSGAGNPRAAPKSKAKGANQQDRDSELTYNFLAPNFHNAAHLPTPTLSNSNNPTEAATAIKPDPDTQFNSLIGSANEEGETFYDTSEFMGEEEEAASTERECELCVSDELGC